MVERTHRRDRARPGRARRAATGGGRRRNLGRLRAGAGRRADADRPADRPGRAVVLCAATGARRGPAPRAEVRQLRRRRFLRQGLCDARNERHATGPRGDLPHRQEPVRARLRARHGRQHQRAAGRRLPDHADRCLPGLSRSGSAGAARRAKAARLSATGPARRWRCTRRSTRAAMQFDAGTRCVIHTHSTPLRRAQSARAGSAELLPPITPYFVMKVGHVPLIAYQPSGRARGGRGSGAADRALRRSGRPIRAVMLQRLGPNVWHDTPAAAMAVLEELEETARLSLLRTRAASR